MSTAEQMSEVVCLCLCTDGSDSGVKAEEEEVRDYRVKCLNNLATTQLKLEQYEEALHTSRDVLTLEPNNVKSLFRTGKVRAHPVMLRQHHCISFDPYWSINDYWLIIIKRNLFDMELYLIIFEEEINYCYLFSACIDLWVDQHCSHCKVFYSLSAPVRHGWIQRGNGGAKKGLETGAGHQGEIVWVNWPNPLANFLPNLHPSHTEERSF